MSMLLEQRGDEPRRVVAAPAGLTGSDLLRDAHFLRGHCRALAGVGRSPDGVIGQTASEERSRCQNRKTRRSRVSPVRVIFESRAWFSAVLRRLLAQDGCDLNDCER